MNNNSIVAAKIKEIRIAKNILQRHIAKGLGISDNTYSRIEGGFTQITINNLYKIAEILDKSVETILGLKAATVTNNNNTVVMSQFNDGTVNIQLTPQEFSELYSLIKAKKTA
jgi:transcriptional regulator with XRE-family HTH domain